MMGKSDGTYSRLRNSGKITTSVFIFMLFGLLYYSLSYSWENKELLEKYEAVSFHLNERTKQFKTTERILQQEKKSLTTSNNDLQSQINTQSKEKQDLINKLEASKTKLVSADGFFVSIKELFDKLDDADEAGDTSISESTYSVLLSDIKDKLQQMENDLKIANDTSDLQSKEIEEQLEKIQNLETQIEQQKEQVEQLKEEKDKLESEKRLRGLKAQQSNLINNVKMEDLNEKILNVAETKTDRKPVETKPVIENKTTTEVKENKTTVTKDQENKTTVTKDQENKTTTVNDKEVKTTSNGQEKKEISNSTPSAVKESNETNLPIDEAKGSDDETSMEEDKHNTTELDETVTSNLNNETDSLADSKVNNTLSSDEGEEDEENGGDPSIEENDDSKEENNNDENEDGEETEKDKQGDDAADDDELDDEKTFDETKKVAVNQGMNEHLDYRGLN